MRCFLRCTALGALTAFAAYVRAQSLSCYITTTVVFGDAQSILSSLSIVSNLTSISTSEIATSFHTTATISPASTLSFTTTSTTPDVTGLFRIKIEIPGPNKLRTRGVQYVAFSGTTGILVSDPQQAAFFQLNNGYLETSTGLFVSSDTSSGYNHFETSTTPPTNHDWSFNSDGNLKLAATSDFCYSGNGELFIVSNNQILSDCTVVNLGAAEVMTAVTSSTLPSMTTATSVSQGATPSGVSEMTANSNSAPVSPASDALGLISTLEGNSQGPSLTSVHSQVLSSKATSYLVSLTPNSVLKSTSATSSPSSLSSSALSTWAFSNSNSMPSSGSAPGVISNPTSIVGPGQMSTQVSTIYSLPFSVSSYGSSTVSTSSLYPLTFSSSRSTLGPLSKLDSTSGQVASLTSTTGAVSSVPTSSAVVTSSTPSSSFISSINSTSSVISPNSLISSSSFSPSTSSSASSSTVTTTAAAATTVPSLPSPYVRNNGKRGLAYTNVTLTQFYSLAGQNSQISWSYDYYSLPNASDNTGPVNPALTFIPLLYNDNPSLTSIWATNVNYSVAHYNTDALFSFNEPDACYSGQSACMSVNASVAGYRAYMQPFAGRGILLGAPAVTNGAPPASLTYLSYFLGNCTACTIDFINLHWYSSPYSFTYLQSYIAQAYAVGGNRPIYLTEFGMDSVYYAESDVASFLKNATTWLDAQPYVRRYAWFGDFAQSGPTNQQGFGYLVNNQGNGLSAEGMLWNNYTGGYVPCPGSSC